MLGSLASLELPASRLCSGRTAFLAYIREEFGLELGIVHFGLRARVRVQGSVGVGVGAGVGVRIRVRVRVRAVVRAVVRVTVQLECRFTGFIF
jgi:hypothetical protein